MKIPSEKNILKVGKWALIILAGYFVLKFFTKGANRVAGLERVQLLNPNTPIKTLTENEAKAFCSRVISSTYWFTFDSAVYSELLALPDNDLIYVSNIWNINFMDESNGKTITEFLKENKVFTSETNKMLDDRLAKLTTQ